MPPVDDSFKNMLRPLGVFGLNWIGVPHAFRCAVDGLSGYLGAGEGLDIARYLRSAPMLHPSAENTRDLIGHAFSIPGGSAIMSDGRWFWRLDTADYVEHYAVALPHEFLKEGRFREWKPVEPTEQDLADWWQKLAEAEGVYWSAGHSGGTGS